MKLSNKGFSLVELMVVVAIIGLLAAIAVPQFSKFQAKARTSEAKSQLAAIFSAEAAFQVEWLGYASDFVEIGYGPLGNLKYNIGFNVGNICPGNYNIARTGAFAITCPAAAGKGFVTGLPAASGVCDTTSIAGATVTGLGRTGGPQCTVGLGVTGALPELIGVTEIVAVGALTYIAGAVARISNNGTVDTWTINQNKAMLNTIVGY